MFLLITLSLAVFDLHISYQQQQDDAFRQASTVSQLLAERLAAGIREAGLVLQSSRQITVLRKLMHEGKLSESEQKVLRTKLLQRLQLAPYLSQIDIINTSCQTIFSSDLQNKLPLRQTEFCQWLHRLDPHDLNITITRSNPTEGGISVADKLQDEDGRIIGMTSGQINKNLFKDEIGRLMVGEQGEILILDLNQIEVARWPLRKTAGFARFHPLPLENGLDPDGRQVLYSDSSSPDHNERHYSINRTGNYPFLVAVGIASQDFGHNLMQRTVIVLFCWLFVAGACLLALRLYIASLRQNRQLSHGAEQIRENDEQTRRVLDAIPLALMLVHPATGHISRANTAARQLLNLPQPDESRESLLNLPLKLPPIDTWLNTTHDINHQEVELELEDQRSMWAMVSLKPLQLTAQPTSLLVIYDISERKQLEQRLQQNNQLLREMAITDPLTKLYNRRHADSILRDEVLRCERYGHVLSIALFDIDFFKKFNDTYGHQAGDNVLVAVASSIRDCTRETDICARIGGEEFLVIFPFARARDAHKVMERIQISLSETSFPFAGQGISFSCGITGWIPDDTPSTLLSRADKLLYKAKKAGRKTIIPDPDAF